jgi:hypothetical protein
MFDAFSRSYFFAHLPRVYTMITKTTGVILVPMALTKLFPAAAKDTDRSTVATIGAGDMGDSLGPRLAGHGYPIVYGIRDAGRERVTQLQCARAQA